MDQAGHVLLGLGIGCLLISGAYALHRYISDRKFRKYIRQLTEEGQRAIREASREVSELTYRDKYGALHVVKIVVDHSLQDNLSDEDKDKMKAMVASGNAGFAGSLQELMGGHRISEDAIGRVEEFVFSTKAVEDMRAQGMEPDEMVRQMLRAAGRIT